jgi:hypothetical protein
MFILLLILKLYIRIETRLPLLRAYDSTLLTVSLLIMFLFAYRKQTAYIVKRIKANE